MKHGLDNDHIVIETYNTCIVLLLYTQKIPFKRFACMGEDVLGMGGG